MTHCGARRAARRLSLRNGSLVHCPGVNCAWMSLFTTQQARRQRVNCRRILQPEALAHSACRGTTRNMLMNLARTLSGTGFADFSRGSLVGTRRDKQRCTARSRGRLALVPTGNLPMLCHDRAVLLRADEGAVAAARTVRVSGDKPARTATTRPSTRSFATTIASSAGRAGGGHAPVSSPRNRPSDCLSELPCCA